ncbi:MAG: rhodanese-like domain-containing protein [Hyphomonadaceae bacterium]
MRVLILLALAFLAATTSPALAQARAAAIAEERRAEQSIAARFANVPQLTLAEFDRLRRDRTVILVDVREADEYAISHLPGAIRVPPGASAEDAQRLIGQIPRGGAIVFYCTIGFRSSRLADRVRTAYGGGAAPLIASLRGGLIAWVNDGRTLVNAAGTTSWIHPYDAQRRRMLIDPTRAQGSLHGWP